MLRDISVYCTCLHPYTPSSVCLLYCTVLKTCDPILYWLPAYLLHGLRTTLDLRPPMSVFNKIHKRKVEEVSDSPEPLFADSPEPQDEGGLGVEPAAGAASTTPTAPTTPTAFLTPETSPTPRTYTTLRECLERHESKLFPAESLADVQVDRYELEIRMSSILNSLVAHQSICKIISDMQPNSELPKSLRNAIDMSTHFTDFKQRKVLFKVNKKCNQAKHDLGLGSL